MPIKIPNALPATQTLEQENIFVMTETRAMTQDIRPLQVCVLNLMPTKVATETQLARLLGNTPLQVELELMQTSSHKAKNTSEEHMIAFYKKFDELRHRKFDGLIITGAPVEHNAFEEVEFWPERWRDQEWSKTNVHSIHTSAGAPRRLYYHYGIQKLHWTKSSSAFFPTTVRRQQA
jgi:homoserine O-succinyltransferase